MNYRIDTSSTTALAICDCGQRFLAENRPAALARLAVHEAVWHPEDNDARTAIDAATRREFVNS